MEKSKLEKFIGKYNLGGSCESVTLKSDGDNLSVRTISADKNVLVEIAAEKINFPEGEFGVYDTKKLRSILGVLDENIVVNPSTANGKTTGLNLSDNSTKATFVLADATVIPAVPELKKLPIIDFTILLDDKFVNTFVKAKSALNDVETFTVMSSGNEKMAEVVIGHSTNNTNRISISVATDVAVKLAPISFSANYLREILTANKEVSNGTLQISSKGLSVVKFDSNGYASTYYLVQISI
jgi:hypothetical protein